MEEQRIDISSGKLFPWHFQLVGVLLFLGGLVALLESPVVSVFLLPLGGWILTSKSGVELDLESRTFKEYNSYFFVKQGKIVEFDAVEKLYINAKKISQRMYTYHTTQSSEFKNIEYSAYLKFQNGIKLHLLDNKDKQQLIKDLAKIETLFNLKVVDNTI